MANEEYVPQRRSSAPDLIIVFFVLIALWGAAAYFLNNRSTFNTAEEDLNVPTPGDVASAITARPEDYIGQTTEQIVDALGEPTATAQNSDGTREIWAYQKNADDATALYLFIENGVVANAIEDEYDGNFDDYTWLEE
jgi:hypothetical protein